MIIYFKYCLDCRRTLLWTHRVRRWYIHQKGFLKSPGRRMSHSQAQAGESFMNKFILFEPEKCIGCRTCALACSFQHEEEFNPSLSRINTLWLSDIGRFATVTCQQCEQPMCAEACPMNAIRVDKQTTSVVVDDALCIGCRSCFIACPFGIPLIHRTKGSMIKCDLCLGIPSVSKNARGKR